MKSNIFKKTASVVLSAIMALSVVTAAAPTEAKAATKKSNNYIIILHTNDIHASTEQTKDADGNITNIGFAAVAAYKKSLQKKYGKSNVTLVDAGDAMQGENIATVSKGLNITKIMNTTGYDLAIPGNHEFDYGFDNFLKLAGSAKYPYLCCNLTYKGTGDTVLRPYEIVNYDGTKVAYVGIDTPETFTKSTPKYFQDANGNWLYSFAEDETGATLYKTVQSTVDAARKAGAKYVVALGHLGESGTTDRWTSDAVIENTTGIDVLIDGHSHEEYDKKVKNKDGENVVLAQTGTKLANLGRIVINKKTGKISAKLIKPQNENKTVANYVKAIKSGYETEMNEVLATSKYTLYTMDPANPSKRIIRTKETNLGDLCADAYKAQLNSDIAIVNGGGIRIQIEAGKITKGTAYTVFPFNNTPVVIKVTGKQLRDFLEFSYRKVESDENGGFAHVSGITCTVDTSVLSAAIEDEKGMFTGVKDGKYRVTDIKVNGEALDLNKTYTVAGTTYTLLLSGDGNTAFSGCEATFEGDANYNDADLLADYLKTTLKGTIPEKYSNPLGEGRITIK